MMVGGGHSLPSVRFAPALEWSPIYIGPQLYGAGSDLVPVTLSFVDASGNHLLDMIVHFHYKGWLGFSDSEQELVYINENGGFRPATPDELHAVERYLQQHGQ